MSRHARTLSVAGAVAAVVLLTGCQKPAPDVTVLSGSTTTVVRAQTYCFDANIKHCRIATHGNVGSITARAGSAILVDVPRVVAAGRWNATSAVEVSSGKFQTIAGVGHASPTRHDTHSTRLTVPYGVHAYFLVVQQAGPAQTGAWVTRVTVTG